MKNVQNLRYNDFVINHFIKDGETITKIELKNNIAFNKTIIDEFKENGAYVVPIENEKREEN